MSDHHERGIIPPGQHSASFSDTSFGSNSTIIASPGSPNSLKKSYDHEHEHEHDHKSSISAEGSHSPVDRELHSFAQPDHGLGISNLGLRKRGSMKASQGVPCSADPLLSPVSAALGDAEANSFRNDEGNPYNDTTSDVYENFEADSDRQRLQNNMCHELGNGADFSCRSERALATGRGSWTAVSILALSIYSTVFSGIWLCIPILKPRYTNQSTIGLTVKNASVLATALARSIELSFATVFVALVGQVLSTRAIGIKKSVTLAEILMRSWVMQPGNMLTHWESVRYAVTTWLGRAALLVAVLVMLYTTASDALVAPNLNVVRPNRSILQGKVMTSFADNDNVVAQCLTPINESVDPEVLVRHVARYSTQAKPTTITCNIWQTGWRQWVTTAAQPTWLGGLYPRL